MPYLFFFFFLQVYGHHRDRVHPPAARDVPTDHARTPLRAQGTDHARTDAQVTRGRGHVPAQGQKTGGNQSFGDGPSCETALYERSPTGLVPVQVGPTRQSW